MALLYNKIVDSLPGYIRKFLTDSDERTANAKKNIATTFLIKIGSVGSMILLVPVTIGFVNPTQYGIWLGISSIIGWLGFFDIGLGNGLKNKLAEAVAQGNHKLAKSYVSTTYVATGSVSLFIFLVYFLLKPHINWAAILNAKNVSAAELDHVGLVIAISICSQFVLQLIPTICTSLQRTMLSSLIVFLSNFFSLIVVYIFTRLYQTGTLLQLTLIMGICLVVVYSVFSLILFNTIYKAYAPSLRLFKFQYAKDILRLGIKFFYIQIGLIFFYNADNFIISRVAGPAAITPYNIAFRYFTAITMISAVIMAPFWPAFTEAHVKNDHDWIRKTVRQLKKVVLILLLFSVFMLLISPIVYQVWVPSVHVPFVLSLVLAYYTILNTYRTIFSFYANATGKITIQAILIVASGLINIPLGFLLGKHLGALGVVLATAILSSICGIFEIAQYKKLISNKATGYWNK